LSHFDLNLLEPFIRPTASTFLLAAGIFLVWFAAVLDIVKNDFKNGVDKIVWSLFVILLPPIGIFLYCIIGRSQKIQPDPPIRSTRYRDIGRD
jgi:uncharacterized protein YhhL (DUF1145 family)